LAIFTKFYYHYEGHVYKYNGSCRDLFNTYLSGVVYVDASQTDMNFRSDTARFYFIFETFYLKTINYFNI